MTRYLLRHANEGKRDEEKLQEDWIFISRTKYNTQNQSLDLHHLRLQEEIKS